MKTKILKEKIKEFIHEYDYLCNPRKIIVVMPVSINISWESDDTVSTSFDNCLDSDIESSKEIRLLNSRIKKFVKKTERFGRTFFKDENWLWENILWGYRPERNEKFDCRKLDKILSDIELD